MTIPIDFAQVNLLFDGEGLPTGAQMTFGVDVSAFSGEPDAAGAQVNAEVAAADIMGNVTDFITYRGCLVKYGPDATGPSALVSDEIVGALESQAAPPNVSALIRKLTAAGGRSGRGRCYLPGIAEGDIFASGALGESRRDGISTAFNAFRTAMATADLPLVVLHQAGAPLTTPTPITFLICDTNVATQRRRLRR